MALRNQQKPHSHNLRCLCEFRPALPRSLLHQPSDPAYKPQTPHNDTVHPGYTGYSPGPHTASAAAHWPLNPRHLDPVHLPVLLSHCKLRSAHHIRSPPAAVWSLPGMDTIPANFPADLTDHKEFPDPGVLLMPASGLLYNYLKYFSAFHFFRFSHCHVCP